MVKKEVAVINLARPLTIAPELSFGNSDDEKLMPLFRSTPGKSQKIIDDNIQGLIIATMARVPLV